MEALLIYNPNAGGSAEDQAKMFQAELQKLGYHPTFRATRSEDELDRILPEARGLVVVVGGDGTLRAVTTRIVDQDVRLFLIPNGTANNVGRTLGIEGRPMEVLQGLTDARRVPVDMGRMRLPWGDTYFMEGAGMGLFAEALASYKPDDGKSFLRGIKTLAELLADLPSRHLKMRLDDEELEGDYILVEAMNMGAIGPRLSLAPKADPADGFLDVVKIKADERESYITYLTSLLNNDVDTLESVKTTRCRKLEIQWTGFPLHQDASCISFDESSTPLAPDTWVTIDLLPSALTFLVPEKKDYMIANVTPLQAFA